MASTKNAISIGAQGHDGDGRSIARFDSDAWVLDPGNVELDSDTWSTIRSCRGAELDLAIWDLDAATLTSSETGS